MKFVWRSLSIRGSFDRSPTSRACSRSIGKRLANSRGLERKFANLSERSEEVSVGWFVRSASQVINTYSFTTRLVSRLKGFIDSLFMYANCATRITPVSHESHRRGRVNASFTFAGSVALSPRFSAIVGARNPCRFYEPRTLKKRSTRGETFRHVRDTSMLDSVVFRD